MNSINEKIIAETIKMRKFQKDYFAGRSKIMLNRSKKQEAVVDKLLSEKLNGNLFNQN